MGLFKKKKSIEIKSPVKGKTLDLAAVPDEVFAAKLVGDGIAFQPEEGVLYSPVDGQIINVFSTKHAIGIKIKEGIEILIHVGIDTVNLKGEGFENFVTQNQIVTTGQKLLTFDMKLLIERDCPTVIPLLITNMDSVKSIVCNYGDVNVGSIAMEIMLK